MSNFGEKRKDESLSQYGIHNSKVYWNLSPDELEQFSINKKQAVRTNNGAIAIDTGEFTGRSPKDRFIVNDEITQNNVWWSDINIPFDKDKFDSLYNKMSKYLSEKEVFARDAYVCSHQSFRTNIRVINELPWSNLFAYNMFIRPSEEEITNMTPDWIVINAPGFLANPSEDGTRQHNFSILNFTKKIALIGGTGYTGEIKKGIFSVLNFELPHYKNVLSMHCSANIGKEGDTALFFGLSGTGKTTLSADPNRFLIGDDEHGWSDDDTIFNFEGGCYAKVINLTQENEREIYNAIKKGALLENVVLDNDHNILFDNSSKTENTRVSYPLDYIQNIAKPSLGKNIKNIFFLTCDAYGVLPPISKLTPGQAAFHFISGYTAKIAGTEAGITDPQIVFSTCFGAPFMPLHPTTYAKILSDKIKETNANVWMINTGWTGGAYGKGTRMKLKHTRATITAALNGDLENVECKKHSVFHTKIPLYCPNVPSKVLSPKETWNDNKAFYNTANTLAKSFNENFEKFSAYADEEMIKAKPTPNKNF